MGVWDRDYSKADHAAAGSSFSDRLPPRGALTLIILHVLGFFLASVMRHDTGSAAMFVLEGSTAHPAAIVLHPVGFQSFWTLLFIVYVIWTLGGRIESRLGAASLLTLYVLGTIISGAVYFGFAQLSPDLATYPLDSPAGALVAWVYIAWRKFSNEIVSIFGWLTTFAKAAAIAAAVVAGLVFFKHAEHATGWLLAAAAGTLAGPLVNLLPARTGPVTPRHRPPAPRPAASPHLPESASPADDPPIDDILAKISREGIDALTAQERERLEAARRAKLRRSR